MEFIIIQRKSIKEDASKGLRSNGATRCVQSLDKTSDEWLSRIYFYCSLFCSIGLFTADGGLLQQTVCVNTTPQKTRFRSVNLYKEFACRSKLS